jgi:hypothetical protein
MHLGGHADARKFGFVLKTSFCRMAAFGSMRPSTFCFVLKKRFAARELGGPFQLFSGRAVRSA